MADIPALRFQAKEKRVSYTRSRRPEAAALGEHRGSKTRRAGVDRSALTLRTGPLAGLPTMFPWCPR